MRGYQFTVPGQPIPKARPRVVRLKNGRSHSFTPESTEDYAKKVGLVARAAGVQQLRGRVGIRCLFFRADKRRADLENLTKNIWDALIGIAYADDSQIHQSAEVKDYDTANPRCEVRVWEIPESALETA